MRRDYVSAASTGVELMVVVVKRREVVDEEGARCSFQLRSRRLKSGYVTEIEAGMY